MGLLIILVAFLIFVAVAFMAHVLLLTLLTRNWSVNGFNRALSSVGILAPALIAVMIFVGVLAGKGMSGSVAGLLYVGIASIISGYIVHWRYKTPFKRAIGVGVSVALLSAILCMALAYAISSVSFS